MPKKTKTIAEKAAFKYAEKLFQQKYDTISRYEVKIAFQQCVIDFIAGYNYAQKLILNEPLK